MGVNVRGARGDKEEAPSLPLNGRLYCISGPSPNRCEGLGNDWVAPGEGGHSGQWRATRGPKSWLIFEQMELPFQAPVGGNRWEKRGAAGQLYRWQCPSRLAQAEEGSRPQGVNA